MVQYVIHPVKNGYVVHGDVNDGALVQAVKQLIGPVPLIVSDPPYGRIVMEEWDRIKVDDHIFSRWMIDWTNQWSSNVLDDGAAFYVWGGIGVPGFRPFMKYVVDVENPGAFELANMITWAKKRAYGVQHNYLFTREECAYFTKGNSKKPKIFNVPLLSTVRGYTGYNKKYPAKSSNYRRTNVWTDVTEIMRGKKHPTQKAQRLYEIIIEVHTNPGDWVVDLFTGSGACADAAQKLGRKFVIVESDVDYVNTLIARLK